MRKLAIIITIFLSVGFLGIKNTKANTLPDFTNLNGYTNNYVIFKYHEGDNSTYFLLFFSQSRAKVFLYDAQSTSDNPLGIIEFGSESGTYTCYYLNGNLWSALTNNSLSRGTVQEVYGHYNTGSYGYTDIYTSINLYGGHNRYGMDWNTPIFEANNSYLVTDLPEPELHITDSHNSTTHNATITVDTSDFSEGNYKYKWGYDQMAMQEVVSGTSGFTLTVPYSDMIYFAVLEQDDTLVYETTYTIDYSDMPEQYTFRFYAANSYGATNFVKFARANTDYTNNFFTTQEHNWLYNSQIVALGFYSNSSFTNELFFNGTICYEQDLEVYVRWSAKIPLYTKELNINDNSLSMTLNITEWLPEANYRLWLKWTDIYGGERQWILTRNSYLEDPTYSMENLEPEQFIVIYFEDISTREQIRVDSLYLPTWVNNHGSEELIQEFELFEQAYSVSDSNDALNAFNNFINILSVPLNFIKNIVAYLYEKLNTHTKIFLVGIFVAKLLTTLGKRIIKR